MSRSISYSIIALVSLLFFWGLSSLDVLYANDLDSFFRNGTIKEASIQVNIGNEKDPIKLGQSLGFRILGIAKIGISGLALIYMVMIWVYMIAFSENEERMKSQRMQIVYTLTWFLFLNIPWVLYQIFFSSDKSTDTVGESIPWGWSDFMGGIFWDQTIVSGFLGDLIAFFQIFIFGIAILMFTWGFFTLILSGGDEEKLKSAKNRFIYWSLGLLFMGFVRFWWVIIAKADFEHEIMSVGQKLLSIALFFAGPVAVFFLIFGWYYYITSWGDEERTKKGKSIILNTFIATLILLAAYSFLTDLINFTL